MAVAVGGGKDSSKRHTDGFSQRCFSGAEDRVKMARILLICSWPQEPGNNGSLHARRFRTTSLTSRKPLEFLFDGCGERTGKSRRILSEGGDPGMNQEQGAMPAVVNPTLSEMRKECSENPYTHAAAFIRHSRMIPLTVQGSAPKGERRLDV